jgi:hypothetical protein
MTSKINQLALSRLRNDEHFQFMTDFTNLVKRFKAETLKIVPQFNAFLALYKQEDEVLKKIAKSALTAQIAEADAARDEVFRGMADAVLSASRHYNAPVREAGERLQIVMQTYGNVAKKAEAEETSAIHNLLQELTTKHLADMEQLDLGGWIQELDRRNIAVERLMEARYTEEAGRSGLVLREVRGQVDEAYRVVANRVDALQIVEGGAAGAPWAAFIAEINAIVERTENIVAIRRGRAAAEREREEEEAAEAAGVDVETWRAMQKAAAAAEVAAKKIAAGSAKAVVVEEANAEAVEVTGEK